MEAFRNCNRKSYRLCTLDDRFKLKLNAMAKTWKQQQDNSQITKCFRFLKWVYMFYWISIKILSTNTWKCSCKWIPPWVQVNYNINIAFLFQQNFNVSRESIMHNMCIMTKSCISQGHYYFIAIGWPNLSWMHSLSCHF